MNMKILAFATAALLGIGTASGFAASPTGSQHASLTVQSDPLSSGVHYNADGSAYTLVQPLDVRPTPMPAWESGFANQSVLKKTMENETFFPGGGSG
jgi:hypothetical protein